MCFFLRDPRSMVYPRYREEKNMTAMTKKLDRKRALLEAGLGPVGQRTTVRLLDYVRDSVEERTKDLATRADLEKGLLQVRLDWKADMFSLDKKLTGEIHSLAWKILPGVGVLFTTILVLFQILGQMGK